MNYIAEIKAFYVWLIQNPISGNSQALWHRLMAYCNEFGWIREFTVANSRLIDEIGISRQELDRVRNVLVGKCRISYRKGYGNRAGVYSIISFNDCAVSVSHNVTQDMTHHVTQLLSQDITHDVTHHVTQGGHSTLPLTKLNKTKQNETKHTPIAPKGAGVGVCNNSFERFWETYPRKSGEKDARKEWGRLNPDDDLVEVILSAVEAMAQTQLWQREGGRYIPFPANFLSGERWKDADGHPAVGAVQSSVPPGEIDVRRILELAASRELPKLF